MFFSFFFSTRALRPRYLQFARKTFWKVNQQEFFLIILFLRGHEIQSADVYLKESHSWRVNLFLQKISMNWILSKPKIFFLWNRIVFGFFSFFFLFFLCASIQHAPQRFEYGAFGILKRFIFKLRLNLFISIIFIISIIRQMHYIFC